MSETCSLKLNIWTDADSGTCTSERDSSFRSEETTIEYIPPLSGNSLNARPSDM